MTDIEQSPKEVVNSLEEEEELLSIPPKIITNLNCEEQNEKLKCDFIIKQVIGEGTFATVRLAINKQTGEQVAIKIMDLNRIQKEDRIRIDREIKVLKNLHHPNIVHLYSEVQIEDIIYLVTEYVKGKELFDYIVMKKKLSENESCLFYQQIISGIEYLHKLKYVHRDIKPENLLINEETKELKIVDFGLSNIYTNSNNNLLESACGSPSYAAPEMLNGEKYRAPPVDIWSSGIVLYAMLCGYLPFEDDDNDILYDKICKGKFTIPNHVSEKARDLLHKILVTDPKKRLTIHQIKNHPWFSSYNNKGKLMMSEGLLLTKYVIPVDEDVVSSINKKFNISEEEIRVSILSNKHDNISTIYYLLLHKKIRNKKKSVADIKGDLFKKYCDNKNNLFEKYDKDLNKVLEERKNGYINNFQNPAQPKDLSTNLTEIKRKINSLIEDNENNTRLINSKRLRYFSPEGTKVLNKLIKLNSFRQEWNKSSKKDETKKIMKFKTNLNAFKPKYNTIIKNKENNKKGKNNIIIHKNGNKESNEKEIKEQKEKKIIKKEKEENKSKGQKDKKENNEENIKNDKTISKEQIIEKNDKIDEKKIENINAEENNEHRNLIKHREKKVHYEKKIKKKIINNNDYRINSAKVQFSKMKKFIKNKNEMENIKQPSKYKNIKIKKPMKSQSIYLEEENNFKRHKIKLKECKTPTKENKKLNKNSKLSKPLDKMKAYELTDRIEKKERFLNQTGDTFPRVKKNILLSENISKKSEKKIKMNNEYEKKEIIVKKGVNKRKLISFRSNDNFSQDLSHKLLENSNSQIKDISYNINDRFRLTKFMHFKQQNLSNLEMQSNTYNSYSKLDDYSMVVLSDSYEPFDLNFIYIKTRKALKSDLYNLLDKYKIKYKNIGNSKLEINFIKENASFCAKFDKLKIINDNKDENRKKKIIISVVKLRKLNQSYPHKIKVFEKIFNKLN